MARGYANSMDFLEWQYYGAGQRYLNKKDSGYSFAKDTDVTTGVTGVYQPIYGASAWVQTNHEANGFGVLPKYAGDRTGWRVITADAGSTADGGIAQDGNIPDTVVPTWATVSAIPKTVAHAFSASEVQTAVSEAGDDTTGDMASLREYFASRHRMALNEQLFRDVDYTADTRFESIDRVTSAHAEIAEQSLGAGDADIYGLDRDASTSWSDAIYDGNSGVDRDLTDQLLLDLVDNTKEAGANSTMFMTGTDTYASIQALFEPQVRYQVLNDTKVQLTNNGIQTPNGIDVGITVSQLYGLPIIVSKDVQKDTISRVYLLDTSDPEGLGVPRLGLRIHRPTQYFENGIQNGDPFGINRFGDEGVYRTMGELICKRFDCQGKLRDLK